MPEPQPWDRDDLKFPQEALEGHDPLQTFREDSVAHICHLDDAIRIVEDAQIRPFPVQDESILRNSRVSVCWLSTKEWDSDEYRYGNIRFRFDWSVLTDWRSLYWVEVIDKYQPLPLIHI